MNLLLDKYADNPLIDEVVYWPPENVTHVVVNAEHASIEVRFKRRKNHVTLVSENIFELHLGEAKKILDLVTDIQVVFEGRKPEVVGAKNGLSKIIYEHRAELIKSCMLQYQKDPNDPWVRNWFLEQFGYNCYDLPRDVDGLLSGLRNST